jgi:hypothetical protein
MMMTFWSSWISVRGGVWLLPVRYGQRLTESMGGSPAAAASVSVGSCPAKYAKVLYLGLKCGNQ